MERRPPARPPASPDAAAEELSLVVQRVVRARVRDRHLADDLVQETLTRVLAQRPALEPEAVRPYAIVVAKNLVASARRADGRRAGNAHRLVDLRTSELPEDVVLRGDERSSMTRAMSRLDQRDRDMLISHEVLDVTTKELADGDGTTPGAIAVRLAGARAKLRLEYVLSLRREAPLPPRCRSVLVALSAGDRRRQAALDADGHLASCDRCAGLSEPLLQRRRASAALLPVVALRAALGRAAAAVRRRPAQVTAVTAAAAAAVVAGALVVQGSSGGAQAPPAPGAPAAAPGVAPVPSGAAVGPVSIAGASLAPLRGGALGELAGRPVEVRDAVVSAVPADEGFWVEDGAGGRFWVQLTTDAESPAAIVPGAMVTFTGTLVPTPPDLAGRVGIDAGEGASELVARGFHIEVAADEVQTA